jgi:DnaJ-domain-containing protein 1
MPRLLLLIAIVFSIWYWWSVVKRLPAEKRRSFFWRTAFWGILGASLILVASGRMHWLGAGLAALIPLGKVLLGLGMRALPLLQILSRFKTSPSQFRTSALMIEINFASKHMDGEVLQGEYVGKRLSELSSDQLQTLADELRGTDRESFVLLQAYMLRSGSGQQSGESYQAGNFSDISNDDAYKILGLERDAAEEDIIKAHKRLMQRLHPDRGGSDYLAAKINAAKDQLIS